MTKKYRRIVIVPVERYGMRYGNQFEEWFTEAAEAFAGDVVALSSVPRTEHFGAGGAADFLDPILTHSVKARQTEELASMVANGRLGNDDAVWFIDAWHPGIISLGYMRDSVVSGLTIGGLLHAGTWDPHDALSRRGLGAWVRGFERSILGVLGERLVLSTRYHRSLLLKAFGDDSGLPWNDVVPYPTAPQIDDYVYKASPTRSPVVVWPHRPAPEKRPWEWREAVKMLRREQRFAHWDFIETMAECSTKGDYYDVLSSAAICASAADQETWGFAMIEAAQLGCHIVAPRRLSYLEVFPDETMATFYDNGAAQLAMAIRARMIDHDEGRLVQTPPPTLDLPVAQARLVMERAFS